MIQSKGSYYFVLVKLALIVLIGIAITDMISMIADSMASEANLQLDPTQAGQQSSELKLIMASYAHAIFSVVGLFGVMFENLTFCVIYQVFMMFWAILALADTKLDYDTITVTVNMFIFGINCVYCALIVRNSQVTTKYTV